MSTQRNQIDSKYTLPLGTMRYMVDIMDEEKAIKLATAEGWKDGESLFDYIDPIDNGASLSYGHATYDEAVAFAKKNAARDVFKTPWIREIKLIEEIAGGTRFREWELERRWSVDGDEVEEDLS